MANARFAAIVALIAPTLGGCWATLSDVPAIDTPLEARAVIAPMPDGAYCAFTVDDLDTDTCLHLVWSQAERRFLATTYQSLNDGVDEDALRVDIAALDADLSVIQLDARDAPDDEFGDDEARLALLAVVLAPDGFVSIPTLESGGDRTVVAALTGVSVETVDDTPRIRSGAPDQVSAFVRDQARVWFAGLPGRGMTPPDEHGAVMHVRITDPEALPDQAERAALAARFEARLFAVAGGRS